MSVLAWIWTLLTLIAGAIFLVHPGLLLPGALFLLSGLTLCPQTAPFLEKRSGVRLGGGFQLALAVLFAGLAALGIAQNPVAIRGLLPVPAAPVPVQPKTLVEEGGDFGNQTSKAFTPQSAGWSLDWSFDCASLGDSGNFSVKVIGQDGRILANVERIGDRDSGVEHYRQAGTFHLQIVSECRWNVKVAG